MIKVLIVEDKPPILWSIKQKVQNFSSDILITGEAFNGIEALESIKENQPDIIITDIRMPIMDGLEMITEVLKMDINVKFIIISGHDEFEYARQAMKLGVNEYLLKPVDQNELDKILHKLTSDIYRQKNTNRQKLIYDMLNKDIPSKIFSYYFNVYNRYYLVLFCGGSYSHYPLNYSHPHNFFVSEEELQHLTKGILHPSIFFWPIATSKLNEMIGIFCVPENISFDPQKTVQLLFNELDKQDFPITVLLSKTITKLEDISKTASSLSKSLRKNTLFGYSSIILEEQAPTSFCTDKVTDIEHNLILSYKKKDRTTFIDELSKFIDSSSNLHYTQTRLESRLKKILGIMVDSSKDLHMDNYQLDIEEIVMFNDNYCKLHTNLDNYFNSFFENQMKQSTNKAIHEIVEQIETYIKKHYSEQITINDISTMFSVDPCYLSKSFKQYKKISPMNYLTQTRIDVAKDLMKKDPSMKLKEIAEIVGYSNQYYFSRIFKSVTNLSPSAFKDNLIKEQSVN
ncbi:response regulator transcription factor [Vallitalea guaymasensis]|uniref:Stage 0 sporulation protein A homolog n=1 Tax=Vallitalea guaymasensis TaxID=1185412 RepID=A0A8J8SDT1_9FIRM|nr:response regulator [Vallitalea guaymasensis]QUH30835.1 response regulator [Vallitalea guaymasensis]